MGEPLAEFVRESNRIEGIVREPSAEEIEAHEHLLALDAEGMTVEALCEFVYTIARVAIRDRPGMDVRVGNHHPIPGGPRVRHELEGLLSQVAHPYFASEVSPFAAHVEYELLHPFMDGNGRSGRALWAWMMFGTGQDPFALPFLHRFYYQALDASRLGSGEPVAHG